MSWHAKVCLVVVGTFFVFVLVQNESRKLAGYKYPVYTTAFCPRNETEWIERSSALNCNKSNGYTCLPNENLDQLLEFCYIVPVERIQKGFCLYLVKRVSLTNSYSCSHFTQGCHNHPYFSNEIYKYPACISLGNGCFLAEPSCKSTTTHPQQSSEHPELDNTPINENDDALFVPILLGILTGLCILSLLSGYYIICRRRYGVELHEENEIGPLLEKENHSINGLDCSHEEEECTPSIEKHKDKINQESQMEKSIFDQWEQDESCFISTNACEEVEKIIKSRNLVIVGGHSGSGKSAIIQHIALKYRKQGWTVRRVTEGETCDYYFAGEMLTPINALSQMNVSMIAGLSKQRMYEQRDQLVDQITAILQSKATPAEMQDKCRCIKYNDQNWKLADVIMKEIDKDSNEDHETKYGNWLKRQNEEES